MWHLCFLQVTMWQALLLTGHLLSVGLFSVVRASCDPQPITGEDAEFCSDDLQVEYGSLGDMSCQKVTLCENVIQYLKEAPQFTYSKAQEDKVYVLIMVDPDAPSREDPIRGPWRHWLVADIQPTEVPPPLQTLDITDINSFSICSPQVPPLLSCHLKRHFEVTLKLMTLCHASA
ncbi:phosphatidylethanolamine-binding protein 4 isoform X2 [Dendropsophus ebraccatus]|uniref:phosphatidylethanolamine-binding protein 4 isoform X2 n=1 Tax=Dendropsophus ebraccatus TaxID=150705 RepID=UPI003831FE23